MIRLSDEEMQDIFMGYDKWASMPKVRDAQLLKVKLWLEEPCPHTKGGIPGGRFYRRHCRTCWADFLSEVG